MPGRLLESSRPKQWSLRSALPSILFHATLILLAIRATARATEVFRSPSPSPHFDTVRLPTSAPEASAGGTGKRNATPTPPRDISPKTPQLPTHIVAVIPPIASDVSTDVAVHIAMPSAGDFKNGVGGQGNLFGNGGPGGHGHSSGGGPNGDVFGPNEVDRQVYIIPGSLKPTYPEPMRTAAIQGEVLAEFVVDTTGRVERSSIRILSTTNEMFATAVRAALSKGRFLSAEWNGKKVPERVQQTFTFTMK